MNSPQAMPGAPAVGLRPMIEPMQLDPARFLTSSTPMPTPAPSASPPPASRPPASPPAPMSPGTVPSTPPQASHVPTGSSMLLADSAQLQLLDSLPSAVLVIDGTASICYVNQRTCDLLKISRDELSGCSVLDFVLLEDLDFAARLLTESTRFPDQAMGPCRVRYVDSEGTAHWTQIWANSVPTGIASDGFVLTLTSESVRDVLATAVGSVAVDDELDSTLAAVALSTRAMPLVGRGVMLVVEHADDSDESTFRAIGEWPIDTAALDARGTPWRQALIEREALDIDDVELADLHPLARAMLRDAGVAAIFVRPILDVSHRVAGVLVVFRSTCGTATANQDDHLGDAVRLARLAFAQAAGRRDLELAAHRDGLTGVANRTAFNKRIERERRSCDVLFVDLDDFKAVNDTHGHPVGDLVIAEAAARINASVRRDDVVYRTGGDEFVVVCEANGDNEQLRIAMATRIVDGLAVAFDVGEHRVEIAATVGIASGTDRDLSAAVRAADAALYAAKERGGAGWSHAPAAG